MARSEAATSKKKRRKRKSAAKPTAAHPELPDRRRTQRLAALERLDDADARTRGQVRRATKMW